MPMTDPGDLGSLNPSPFATRPSVMPPEPASPPAAALDDKTVDALLLRLQEAKRRRSAAPASPATPATSSFFSRVDWDGIRKKFWYGALVVGSAYASSKPEKYGWLMPVLTAVAGTSAPPTASPKAAMALVLTIIFLVSGARAVVWAWM